MDMTNVATRLETKFGLGTRPDLRKALYARLEHLVEEYGDRAYVAIASAAADAVGKENPGRYFARVVMLRLYERHVIQTEDL